MPTQRRIDRINKTLMKEIGMIIMKDVKDPRLTSMVSVVSAEMSSDYKNVRVVVSIYGDNEVNNLKSLEALQAAAGYIASLTGDALRLKYTPRLRFESTDSIARGVDMYFKLKELNNEEEPDTETPEQ